MSIGEAVATLRLRYPSVTHSSLRFLEREGLVKSSRTGGGHRLYAPADLERVLLIKGWQIGFPLLAEGSEAILYVPSGLAYGGNTQPSIPANSNLIFNVKLLKVQ